MDFKITNLYPSTLVGQTQTIDKLKSRSAASSDRDSNGQMEHSGKQKDNPFLARAMTEEEFALALKKLKSVPGFVESGFVIQVEKDAEERRLVLILDSQQNVIRRFKEADLGAAFLVSDTAAEKKGSLINTAA